MKPPTIRSGEVVPPPPLERAGFLRPVSLLGRWTDALGFPQPGRHPSEFQDPEWDLTSRNAVARYLDTGFLWTEQMYAESCRMGCGMNLYAGRCYTDGFFAWTGALSHYVVHHQLRTPECFTEHACRPRALPPGIRNRILRLGARYGVGLLVSDAWWLSQQGWSVSAQGTIE